ncbi:hypothetical protein RYZ20_10660 [Thioclava sp. A2]|uniref:hypothetical protein n=1 Tax=Thioclava sp. FCG-A2 TaxID=3080562 RepID=UPI002953C4B5|nr:hypothetical protein [Thioclava sp. A2]MDV7271363.1 hypothetical protein [Thioclava sp. A2]
MTPEDSNFEAFSTDDINAQHTALAKRLASLNVSYNENTIATRVSGNLNYNCRQFRYRYSDFSGDVVFFDQNFIAAGACVHTNLRLNLRTDSVWSLEFDDASRTVTLNAGNSSAVFVNPNAPDATASLRFSIPENRVIFAVRKTVSFGGCTLNPGSSIIING